MSDDPLYYAKNVPGAGKNTRTEYDGEETGDEGENLTDVVSTPAKPRITSKKRFQLVNGQEQLGTPPSGIVTSTRNPRAGGRNFDKPYCAAGNNDMGHPKATHIFYGLRTGENQAGWPLCPQHLAKAEEKLKIAKAKNPDVLVRPSEDITHAVLNKNLNLEKDMRDDKSALMSMYLVAGGVHPDSLDASVGADKANAGRTPYHNSEDWPEGAPAPTVASERSPEHKEAVLNYALERSRKGVNKINLTEGLTGTDPTSQKEYINAGQQVEDSRDFSKPGYAVDRANHVSRVYPGNKEAQRRRTPKAVVQGTGTKKSTNTATDFETVDAPIDNVLSALRVAKGMGTKLTKDVVSGVIEEHGEGVVKPEHIRTALTVRARTKKPDSSLADSPALPFKKPGAFARYKEELSTPADTAMEKEEREDELWGLTSRNDNFFRSAPNH